MDAHYTLWDQSKKKEAAAAVEKQLSEAVGVSTDCRLTTQWARWVTQIKHT